MLSRFLPLAMLALSITALLGCGPQADNIAKKAAPATSENTPSPTSKSGDSQSESSPAATEAKSEPSVSLKPVDFDGFQVELKKHSGKYVLVDVWSTACLPCMKEYPNLVTLSKRWPDRLACVSLNVDYTGIKSKPMDTYIPKVTAFLDKQKSTSVVNLISSLPDSDIYTKLAIDSIPSILLYDTEGKLLKQFAEVNAAGEAMTYEKDIIPELESMLK